ncbi:MAG: hypothetical protein ACRD0U_20240, partial [Acidimicrobiales bacterium]
MLFVAETASLAAALPLPLEPELIDIRFDDGIFNTLSGEGELLGPSGTTDVYPGGFDFDQVGHQY